MKEVSKKGGVLNVSNESLKTNKDFFSGHKPWQEHSTFQWGRAFTTSRAKWSKSFSKTPLQDGLWRCHMNFEIEDNILWTWVHASGSVF